MFRLTPARSRIRGAAGVAASSLVVAIVAAGCGSSNSSSSANASSSAKSNGANITAAQQVVTQAMQRPASITVTAPVGKAVPSGKKVVYISCGVSVCQLQGQIVATAAKALGWTTSTVATAGTPTSVIAAYQTALHQGANAIVTTAALRAEIASVVPALQSKGIVVSDCCSTDPVASPFIYNTSTPSQSGAIGKALAAEVVANSSGKANTLYVNIPAFTILSSLESTFKQAYSQYCPTCGYASIDVGLTQLATAPNLIVSYLRSHPSVNYVALSVANELDSGLPAALSAAGLSNVKIVGQGGGPTDFQYVASGQELALVPFDYYTVDYQMVDALARHFAGVPVQLTRPPLWMVTKANLPSGHANLFPDVTAYQSQFLKLWGKTKA
ncbi:MAG TPA: substrate-binding domain-containing protein [Solirubrobacteraceae bacterium]|nr:substrate-binding domain-containing protein [Solirubrobacteraceae bacterium]